MNFHRINRYTTILRMVSVMITFLILLLCAGLSSVVSDSMMNGTQTGKSMVFLWVTGIIGALAFVRFGLRQGMERNHLCICDLLLFAFMLYVLFSNDWAELIHSLFFLELIGLSILYLVVRQLSNQVHWWILMALTAGGLIQAVYGNLQLFGYYPSHHGLFRMTGSFFNPGPYAGYLAAVLPVALGFYLFNNPARIPDQHPFVLKLNSFGNSTLTLLKRIPLSRFFYNHPKCGDTPETQADWLRHMLHSIIQYFAMFAMIAMCLVLPASRSRSAWLAVVVSAGYILWVKYLPLRQLREWVNTPVKRFLLVFTLVILLISMGAGLYYFKKGSADGRVLIWKVSGKMIKDKPIFGHGADQFAADYMNYQAAYFAPNPDVPESLQADNVTYAYNEFLKLTVEYGLIGLLLALAVLWSLFFVKTDSEKNKDRLSLLTARGGLLSILVFALFSYPSDILPIRMLLVLLMAIVAGHQTPLRLFRLARKETPELPSHKTAFTRTAVLYTALAVAMVAVYPAGKYINRQYLTYQSWKDASDIYNVGAYPECLEDFELAYPLLKTNGTFLVQYGKALEMAGKYDSSVVILKEAKQHLNNTILYTCLGNNYKALGKHPEAEQAYLQAWHMAPARFYPLYLLAKLYDEIGQQEKAVAMAKEVMEKEVKIESTAIKEIQEEMRKIIEKQDNTQDMSNPKGKGRKHNLQVAIASCLAPFLKKESEVR